MSSTRNVLPGFHAEAALSKSNNQYATITPISSLGQSGVYPQLSSAWRGNGWPCDPNCVCVTGEGCPCCFNLPSWRWRWSTATRRSMLVPPLT